MGPSTSRDKGSESEKHEKEYGLFPLHSEVKPDIDVPPYSFDIVAIHGITGDAHETWTHANGKLWLRDFVPQKLPGARVFTFGYPADVFRSLDRGGGFENWARQLLELLTNVRKGKEKGRPLIFVCHSMGGIVLKKALATALLDNYNEISSTVKGIMFLATPHRGSSSASLSALLKMIAQLATTVSKRGGTFRADLLQDLEKDAKVLTQISQEFRNRHEGIKIATFYEQKPIEIVPYSKPTLIVEEESAVMNGAGERLIPMAGCDHTSICKFSRESENSYALVWGILQEWADDARNVCLQSLAFPEMCHRREDAKRLRHKDTCKWILTHDSYVTWLNQHHGLLWLKGKPGSGKSILLSFLYDKYQQEKRDNKRLVLHFFFHARGTPLQKTREGMFRSLLNQLCRKSVAASSIVASFFNQKSEDFGKFGESWYWNASELEKLFNDAVTDTIKSDEVTLFVDALDEAGLDIAPQLAEYFYALETKLPIKERKVKICISCRHYPALTNRRSLEVLVDEENSGDIALYVRNMLRASFSADSPGTTFAAAERQTLRSKVCNGANGLFQWAWLTVQLILRLAREGETLAYILRKLKELPPELEPFYEHILKSLVPVRKWPRTLLLAQWIAYAERPISVEELLYALVSDGVEPPLFVEEELILQGENERRRYARVGALVNSLSGGLIEVKINGKKTAVQFIHESAREFFMRNGLKLLSKAPTDATEFNLLCSTYGRLATSCINYMKRPEVLSYPVPKPLGMDLDVLRSQLPFIDYSSRGWLCHFNLSELYGPVFLAYYENNNIDAQNQPADRILALYGTLPRDPANQFEYPRRDILENWWKMFRALHFEDAHFRGIYAKLLYIKGGFALSRPAKFLVENGILPTDDSEYPLLHQAVEWGHEEFIQLLLNKGLRADELDENGSSAIDLAAHQNREAVLKVLLLNLANQKPHTKDTTFSDDTFGPAVKCYLDWGSAVKLKRYKAQKKAEHLKREATDPKSRHPFTKLVASMAACIIPTLSENGNALRKAVSEGHIEEARILLDWGSDPNASGGICGTALVDAASRGDANYDIVRLLLRNGADVNREEDCSASKCHPVVTAAIDSGDGTEVIELLCNSGARLDGDNGNVLGHALAKGKNADTFYYLFGKGVDVDRLDYGCRHYQCPLKIAAAKGDSWKDVVQYLLDHGVDVDAYEDLEEDPSEGVVETFFQTPLQAAILLGDENKEIVEILLSHGADYNLGAGAMYDTISTGDRAVRVLKLLLAKGLHKKKRFLKYDKYDILDCIMHGKREWRESIGKTVDTLRKAGFDLNVDNIPHSQARDPKEPPTKRSWLVSLEKKEQTELFYKYGLLDDLGSESGSHSNSDQDVEMTEADLSDSGEGMEVDQTDSEDQYS
ncbi:Protein SERAC1 [Lachnellula arida]|uniref:Protein SERAC1 n=1 Tax=Lachnellula arida TaxID=1316785 RepID=A0A8T9BJU4_9HELO|nr:Protein SERAC1 [Lachnellula arida]